MKTCMKCGVTKPLSEFHRHKYGDGFRPDCKECRRKYGRERQRKMGRELTLRKYGIGETLYTDILEVQKGGCALCGAALDENARALAVDHDHETNHLRGILCSLCNGGLGMFRDNPELLERAAHYLRFWRTGWSVWSQVVGEVR